MKRLILAGGGHAHLAVLDALARRQPRGVDVVLVTPSPFQTYSGMLPGWIAGHYTLADCRIDLRPLARAAGATLIVDAIVRIEADHRRIVLAQGKSLDYDLLSIDVGSDTDTTALAALGELLLPVKPLDAFTLRWPRCLAEAAQGRGFRLAVVGGGAAGIEIALAAHHAFKQAWIEGAVALVASASGLLPGHAAGVANRARNRLALGGVAIHHGRARGEDGALVLADGTRFAVDCVIAATGARPLACLRDCGLALDERGYVAVDEHHRSLSHAEVFAAGDTCTRADTAMARSGVHAVRAGPILAHNLLATLDQSALQAYRPRRRSLYLLATGPRHAIASWGRWSVAGKWVWRWKNHIDRGFIRRYTRTPTTHPG